VRSLARVGILGGTGALGRGLALRWAMASVDVRLGSRDAHRAEDAAARLRERLQDRPGVGAISGGTNRAVAASEPTLVLAVPLAGLEASLAEFGDVLHGRTVVCAVNPLAFDTAGPLLAPVPTSSAPTSSTPMSSVAETVAAALPETTVVAALHTVSSHELAALGRPMDDDVPVVGDDIDACAEVAALVDRIEGCRGVVVGALRLAVGLEALTPVLIAVNQRASAHVGVRFSRLPTATDTTSDG
jgi:8-hydroxy-5-deazaflavin:NADPH oxidoreductase